MTNACFSNFFAFPTFPSLPLSVCKYREPIFFIVESRKSFAPPPFSCVWTVGLEEGRSLRPSIWRTTRGKQAKRRMHRWTSSWGKTRKTSTGTGRNCAPIQAQPAEMTIQWEGINWIWTMSETRMFVFKSIVRRKVISKGVFHHNWNFDPIISVIVVEVQIFSLHLIKLENSSHFQTVSFILYSPREWPCRLKNVAALQKICSRSGRYWIRNRPVTSLGVRCAAKDDIHSLVWAYRKWQRGKDDNERRLHIANRSSIFQRLADSLSWFSPFKIRLTCKTRAFPAEGVCGVVIPRDVRGENEDEETLENCSQHEERVD